MWNDKIFSWRTWKSEQRTGSYNFLRNERNTRKFIIKQGHQCILINSALLKTRITYNPSLSDMTIWAIKGVSTSEFISAFFLARRENVHLWIQIQNSFPDLIFSSKTSSCDTGNPKHVVTNRNGNKFNTFRWFEEESVLYNWIPMEAVIFCACLE